MSKWILAVVALASVACGGSPTASTPPPMPAATLAPQGSLLVQVCSSVNASLITCFTYTGTIKNTGPGCASGVRGVTKTFVIGTQNQIGSSEWSFTGRIRPGEEFSYTGVNLTLPAPLDGGWMYQTTPAWDNVACN